MRQREELVFRVELGRRLAELRRGTGQSQRELAAKMGLDSAVGHQVVSKLELGRKKSPLLAEVASYLCACGVGFGAILDILTAYTNLPTIDEERTAKRVAKVVQDMPTDVQDKVLDYDIKTKHARRRLGQEPLSEADRVSRARKMAREWLLRRDLDARLRQACNQCGDPPVTALRRIVGEYGRRVWGVMARTRGRREERERELERVWAWAKKQGIVSVPALGFVQTAVIDFFAACEAQGRLDWLPPAQVRSVGHLNY